MKLAQFTLQSFNKKEMHKVVHRLRELAKIHGAFTKGPVQIKTKKILIPTRKSPDGEGTETWDTWCLKRTKILFYTSIEERFLRTVLRENIHKSVDVSIVFTEK